MEMILNIFTVIGIIVIFLALVVGIMSIAARMDTNKRARNAVAKDRLLKAMMEMNYKDRSRTPKDKPLLLIVEDSKMTAEAILDTATMVGFSCIVAYDGTQGVAALTSDVDAVCVDGHFPNKEQFYNYLTVSRKPFIIYSGSSDCGNKGELRFVLKTDIPGFKDALRQLHSSL